MKLQISEMLTTKRRISCWKVFQFLGYLIAFVGAVITSVTSGNVVRQFDGQCPLYSELNCTLQLSPKNVQYIAGADISNVWSSKRTCNFATFVPMACSAAAFIMAYFVLMFDNTWTGIKKAGVHVNRMVGIFYMLLTVTILFTILMTISASRSVNGTRIFCDGLSKSVSLSCYEAQFYKWEGFPSTKRFYRNLLTAMIASWVSAGAFIFSIVLLMMRCFFGVDSNPVEKKKYAIAQTIRSRSDDAALLSSVGSSDHSAFEPLMGTGSSEPLLGRGNFDSSTYEPLAGPSNSELQFAGKLESSSSQYLTVAT